MNPFGHGRVGTGSAIYQKVSEVEASGTPQSSLTKQG